MPVRKIPKSYTSVTGLSVSNLCGKSIGFESVTGERDFNKVIDNLGYAYGIISWFEEQPVSVYFSYKKEDGSPSPHPILYPYKVDRVYHPDNLVRFNLTGQKPWLCEIKPKELISKHFAEYKPIWRVGIKYAMSKGLIFKVITDEDVRKTNLKTLSFLRRFKKFAPSKADEELLQKALNTLHEANVSEVVNFITRDMQQQIHLTYAIWSMILKGKLVADLSKDYSAMMISEKLAEIKLPAKINKHWLFSPQAIYNHYRRR